MAGPDILVTGFGPFPGVRDNPADALARRVASRLRARGISAEALVLPTSYGEGLPLLKRTLRDAPPRALLMLGLAARSRTLRVELYGRDGASPLHPDAAGATPAAGNRGSALPRRATGSPAAALAVLRRLGLPARLSPSAGRYLCNAAYALALRETEGRGVPVLFVHIPWPRGFRGRRPAGALRRSMPDVARLESALAALARPALLRLAP